MSVQLSRVILVLAVLATVIVLGLSDVLDSQVIAATLGGIVGWITPTPLAPSVGAPQK